MRGTQTPLPDWQPLIHTSMLAVILAVVLVSCTLGFGKKLWQLDCPTVKMPTLPAYGFRAGQLPIACPTRFRFLPRR
jgi:hypothetical protein